MDITPFGENDEYANGVAIPRRQGGMNATGVGGVVITTEQTSCCCGDGSKGNIVLTQLKQKKDFWGRTSWEVDTSFGDYVNGKRFITSNGNRQITGYTDNRSNEPNKGGFKSGSQRTYRDPKTNRRWTVPVTGFIDTPGAQIIPGMNTNHAVIPHSSIIPYNEHFRVEAFCRCENEDDSYTGKSAEYSYKRSYQQSNGEITIGKFNDGTPNSNPSKYPNP